MVRIPMAAKSADALCMAYANAAPMPRTTTNTKAGNDLFLFILVTSSQWLDGSSSFQRSPFDHLDYRARVGRCTKRTVAQTISIVRPLYGKPANDHSAWSRYSALATWTYPPSSSTSARADSGTATLPSRISWRFTSSPYMALSPLLSACITAPSRLTPAKMPLDRE